MRDRVDRSCRWLFLDVRLGSVAVGRNQQLTVACDGSRNVCGAQSRGGTVRSRIELVLLPRDEQTIHTIGASSRDHEREPQRGCRPGAAVVAFPLVSVSGIGAGLAGRGNAEPKRPVRPPLVLRLTPLSFLGAGWGTLSARGLKCLCCWSVLPNTSGHRLLLNHFRATSHHIQTHHLPRTGRLAYRSKFNHNVLSIYSSVVANGTFCAFATAVSEPSECGSHTA